MIENMPDWVEILIAAAAVISAAYVVWTKAIRPTVFALSLLERITPMLAYMASHFPDDESFENWVQESGTARKEFSYRLARIERVIDYEHPPPRDWSWDSPLDPEREYERRIVQRPLPEGMRDRRTERD